MSTKLIYGLVMRNSSTSYLSTMCHLCNGGLPRDKLLSLLYKNTPKNTVSFDIENKTYLVYNKLYEKICERILAMKVLVCDDSVFVRVKMKKALQSAGITDIIEAADGVSAVEMYKQNKPDLVFMDIIMPNKSGVEALTEIRAFDSNAKVIMASSVGTQGNLKEAIEAGAFDFLQKPIEEDVIKKIIAKVSG